MEEDIFKMPILEQMYSYRKEEFEKQVYDKDKEIQEYEVEACELNDELLKFLKNIIQREKDYNKVIEMLRNHELALGKEMYYWGKTYYKLGMNDMYKLKNELKSNSTSVIKGDTFINSTNGEIDEYIQGKINYESESYKKYKNKCKEIADKFPNVLKVVEQSIPIVLNEEEMKELMEIKKLDEKIRAEEVKIIFKAGMNEILNL